MVKCISKNAFNYLGPAPRNPQRSTNIYSFLFDLQLIEHVRCAIDVALIDQIIFFIFLDGPGERQLMREASCSSEHVPLRRCGTHIPCRDVLIEFLCIVEHYSHIRNVFDAIEWPIE
jgi:hypothetical protein